MAEAGAAPACRACNPAPGRSGAPRFGHYDPNAGGHSDFRMALTPTPWGGGARSEGAKSLRAWGGVLSGPGLTAWISGAALAAGSMRVAPKRLHGRRPSARSAKMPWWSAERRAPCVIGRGTPRWVFRRTAGADRAGAYAQGAAYPHPRLSALCLLVLNRARRRAAAERWLGQRSRGCLTGESPPVVPAHAGTHNHRPRDVISAWGYGSTPARDDNGASRDAPAFAGTTTSFG